MLSAFEVSTESGPEKGAQLGPSGDVYEYRENLALSNTIFRFSSRYLP